MGVHLEQDITAPPAAADFWRSPAANGALPDNAADGTETIARSGKVGIGLAAATPPAAQLDVANGGRSGAALTPDPATGFYATANAAGMPGFNAAGLPTPTPAIAEFRHSNGTQGFAFAFDGIYATGSVATQSFGLLNRGGGVHWKGWQALNSGQFFDDRYGGVALTNNAEGWDERYYAGGAQEAGNLIRRDTGGLGGALGTERYWQQRAANGGFINAMRLHPSRRNANTMTLNANPNNHVHDAILALFNGDSSATGFFGFGIKGSTLATFVPANVHHFRWYQCNSGATGAETQVFGVSGIGNVTVDPTGVGPSGWASPVLRFGGEASNDGIRSQRVGADRFLNDIEVYTGAARRFAVLANGRLYAAVVPTFASDALAGAGGLATGEIFKDALGVLHIKA